MNPSPCEILDSMIQYFGRSFHYKDTVLTFLLSKGVNRNLVIKYRNLLNSNALEAKMVLRTELEPTRRLTYKGF